MPPELHAEGAPGQRLCLTTDDARVRRNQYCKKLACAASTRALSVRLRIGTGRMR